jgi:pilus assembly protein FimV
LIAKSHRWQKTAIAAAAVALLSLSATQALALSLGRLTVQSALGEPLRAEIDIPDINAEEAASLKANVAKPAAFVAAGLDYNPAMANMLTTLERRTDGRAFIRLSTDRPINDPFVDVILEATWASGRIVRDYTMLFDPPALRQAAPAPTLPQVAAPVVTTAPSPAAATPAAPSEAVSASTRTPPATKPAVAKSAKAVAPARPAVAVAAPAEGSKQVVVKPGDTASKIVGSAKPAEVSLDQMLVALLRNNPDAFVNSNINRIRSGAVVNLPDAEQAQSVSAAEATQIVVAQSKDFNEFRRNLATNASSATVAAPSRTASGTVETKVEDKKPVAPTPDKLTLSKGAVQSKAADEAKIAKERAEKDAQVRAAEIAKNIEDLKKLSASAAPKPAVAPPAAEVKPAEPSAAPSVAVVPTPAAPTTPAAPEVAAPAMPAAPAPVAQTPPKPLPVPAPPATEAPGLLDDLLQDPLVPAAAGGLIALLGGFGLYRMRQRKKGAAHVDSSFLESRLQPDSFFGASGGQRVDTANENSVGGSSMVYSASQLDAADDVDPVAEADVYLAYGRDLQAEEILKEAARTTPGRLAIHSKLLEIFAKRRDTRSFETTANQAYRLAGSASPDWARICEMGQGIDPNNPLYRPGGSPSDTAEAPALAEAASAFSSTIARAPDAQMPQYAKAVDLDLDLDFSADDQPASSISDVTGASMPQGKYDSTIKLNKSVGENPLEMDFDLSDAAPLSATPDSSAYAVPEISLSMDGVSLTEPDPRSAAKFDATGSMPVQASVAPARDSGMMDFDLGSLSLDLDSSTAGGLSEGPSTENKDPLGTKLALAEEFVSIGDEDGARVLIEEVVAESSGEMRAKAERALASLS